MKFEYQDDIDRFLMGGMTGSDGYSSSHTGPLSSEAAEFLKKVSENDELRDQLEYTRKLKELITDREEKLALLHEWEKKPPHKVKLWPWVSGIAAILVVGFFVSHTYFNHENSAFEEPKTEGVIIDFSPVEELEEERDTSIIVSPDTTAMGKMPR